MTKEKFLKRALTQAIHSYPSEDVQISLIRLEDGTWSMYLNVYEKVEIKGSSEGEIKDDDQAYEIYCRTNLT